MSLVERVKRLCEMKNITLTTLERNLGFSVSSIRKWDDSAPSTDKIKAVAEYFDVSVDYLLGREEAENDEIMELREQLRRQPGMRILFDASKDATKEQLEAMAEMIKKWTT